MEKTRDLFKKIRDTKGTFHAKMGAMKDRNRMDLTEAEDIKRQQEYTELYKKKKLLMIQITTMLWSLTYSQTSWSMKSWALGSVIKIKASGGDGIPTELFHILKDDAVKVPHSLCQQIQKTQQWPQDWKGRFSFQSQRRTMPRNVQTTIQLIAVISHARKVMLKILQAKLQQYMN